MTLLDQNHYARQPLYTENTTGPCNQNKIPPICGYGISSPTIRSIPSALPITWAGAAGRRRSRTLPKSSTSTGTRSRRWRSSTWRLSGRDRRYIKGQKYTLLSHRENLTLEGRQSLRRCWRPTSACEHGVPAQGVLRSALGLRA